MITPLDKKFDEFVEKKLQPFIASIDDEEKVSLIREIRNNDCRGSGRILIFHEGEDSVVEFHIYVNWSDWKKDKK